MAGRPHADSPECTELRSLLRASGLTLSEAWRLYEATFPWPKLVKARFSDWLNGKEKLNATLLFRWRSILADNAVPVGSTSTMRTLEGKAAAQYEKQLRAEGFEPFRADDFGPVETPRDHAEALAQWQEEFDRDFDAERDTPMPSPGPISPEEGRDMEWETGRRKPSLLRGLRGY